MKTLKTIILAAMMLASLLAAQAGPVSGHYRSNGTYVAPYYRSDYVSLGHSTGTYVPPHVRTAPNNTVTDNLSYRGYGTIRVPRYSPGR